MQPFLQTIEEELIAALPACKMLIFGHIADSNLHFICYTGNKDDIKRIYEIVYRITGQFKGSVSAEHGIGVQKLKYLAHSRTSEELALMKVLKRAMDPKAILNRGRVIAEE
jgi:FAD/FMN-containing dehydrogenase